MRETDHHHANLTGSLLVAVPMLLDPNFRRTILFVTRHEQEDGALGIILNRPCGRTLGECIDPPEPLKGVPVFEGGPVERQHFLLARILFMESGARMESLDREESLSQSITKTYDFPQGFRAFTGYTGWSAGQLESEIQEKSWLVLPPTPALLQEINTTEEGIARWRSVMRELGPWYQLLAEAPDDPSQN